MKAEGQHMDVAPFSSVFVVNSAGEQALSTAANEEVLARKPDPPLLRLVEAGGRGRVLIAGPGLAIGYAADDAEGRFREVQVRRGGTQTEILRVFTV
jgi:hypothetical protein